MFTPEIVFVCIEGASIETTQYLRRIHYHGSPKPDVETLRSLHRAHMLSVPFENLDIHLGRTIVLDGELLYEKIVGQNRGGFCYELNGLFGQLLCEIGFDVTMLSARVANGDTLGPEFDHMCMLVQLEERWLVDVGFGDSFIDPLRLDFRDEQIERGVSYRISQDGSDWTLHRRKIEATEERQYVFTAKPRELSEFNAMCHFQQTSPDSHFTQQRICSLATVNGRITLSDNMLILKEGGARKERTLSEAEYVFALIQRFGLDLRLT